MPVSVSVTPAIRGSVAANCGVPPLAPARSRSWNTVPDSDERVTVTGLVPVLLLPGKSTPPVLFGSVSTVATLLMLPPAGKLVMRTGSVMVTAPPALSWPSAQLTVLPASAQLPLAAGSVLLKLTTPVSATPVGRTSVKSVRNELPGPLLTTVMVQSKGWFSVTVPRLAALVTRRSTRWRTVVGSPSLLLLRSLSGSLLLTLARLL